MMRILLVAGARPNFMKAAPVMWALERCGVDVVLVHTGQHHDERMSAAFFADLDIRTPDHQLHCGGGTHASQTADVMVAFEPILAQTRPHAVVVCGDVNSTLACTLVAAKASIPVAHVEAGLRSRDRSMPEEINRIAVDHLSDWLLTPSADADSNLAAEGIGAGRIWQVGNVMVDTLMHNLERSHNSDVLERLGLAGGNHALWTMHRPSNVDDQVVLAGLVRAAVAIAEDRPVVFPVHPRTRQCLQSAGLMELLQDAPQLRLVSPLGYLDFLRLQATAAMVLTDSGGVQEETTVLGVPCLTLRHNTERPITVTEGTNTVVGTCPDRIAAAAKAVVIGGEPRMPTGWDGHAADRIAAVLTTVSPPLGTQRLGVAGVRHSDSAARPASAQSESTHSQNS